MNSTEGSIYYSLGIDLSQLSADANRATNKIKNIGDSAVSEGQKIDQAFKNIAKSVGAVFTVQQLGSFIQQVASVRGEFQKLEVSFSTMLQSKSKADVLMQQLVRTAATTPFDLQGIANGAKQLLAYGESADTVNDSLLRLGNIAAGLSIPLNDLVYLYGTTRVQGRLFTNDLNQFMGRGIPLVQELAKEFGKTEIEIKNMVSAGQIGFKEVQKVIENLTNSGGVFYNLMEEQSKTISGQIANLGDAWDMMLNNIGKSSEGVISGAISSVTELIENYEKVGREIGALIAAYGTYKAILMAVSAVQSIQTKIALESALAGRALSTAQGLHAVATKQLTIAQAALNKTMLANPYVLAAAAVAGLAYGIYKLATAETSAEKAQKKFNDELQKSKEKKEALISRSNELINTINDETKTIYAQTAAWKELKTTIPEALKGLSMDDLKKMSPEQIQMRVNVVSDERDFSELNSQIQNSKDKIEKLKETLKNIRPEYDEGGMRSSNVLRLIEEEEELYKRLKARLGEVNETRREAEFNSRPVEERIAIIEKEIQALTTERDKIEEALESAKKFNSIPGQFNVDEYMNISRLEYFNNLLETAKGKLSSLTTPGVDITKNQAYWDKQKSEAETALKAMDKSDKGSEKWNAKLKLLKEAESNLKTWDFSSKSSSGRNNEDAQRKIAATNRSKAEKDYAERLIIEAKKTEHDIAQSNIDSMKDGLDKQIAQINLNYDRLTFENEQRKAQMIKDLQDLREIQWNEENPEAKKKGASFDRSTITENSLSDKQLSQLKSFEDEANKYRVSANKMALDEILSEFLSYEQERARITEEFENKRKALYKEDGTLKDGVSQENVDQLNVAESNSLVAIDEEFAQREETYESWMNAITSMTLEQLTSTLQQAEAELSRLQRSGATGGQVALARTKVNAAKEGIAKAKADMEISPGKKELKEWQALQDAISDADNQLGDIEDTLDGTAKEIIKTARQIGNSALKMIDGIITLAYASIAGAQTTAVGAAATIATVEKASVILTIISAALMIVTQMFSLFSKKDVLAAFNKELANLNDELSRVKLEARIGNDDRESIFGTDVWARSIDNINAANEALSRYNDTIEKIANRKITDDPLESEVFKDLGKENKFESFEDSIANMKVQVQHGTWFRAEKNKYLSELTELYNKDGTFNMDALKAFRESDMFSKLSEENRKFIDDMVEDWDLYQKAIGETKDALSDIFGDLGATITDYLVDAFKNGSNAAEDFTKNISNMIEVLGKQIIQSAIIMPLADKAQEDILKIMKNTGLSDEEKFDQMTGVIDEFVEGAIERQDMANGLMKKIQDSAAGYGYDIFSKEEEARESAAKGIASMSQDTAEELNGRFTAIQYMTFEINSNVKMLTENSAQSLRHLAGIETNTSRLEAIENTMVSMNRTLGDIQLKGLRIV